LNVRYEVELTASAEKALDRIPDSVYRRIAEKLLVLEENPRPPRVSRKLQAPLEGYRLRVGVWRALYVVNDESRTVTVYAVRHRRDAYRKPTKRR